MSLWWTFCSRRSILLRNRMTDILSNILLLIMVSKMFLDSWTRLVFLSSSRTWSYSEVEAINKMLVTDSKHWNHFCLCVLWPPTSTKRKGTLKIQKISKCSLKNVQLLFLPGYVNPALYHPLGCLPGVENVLQGGHVLGAGHSLQAVKEILDRVSQLILISPVKSSLDTLVRPQLVQHRLKAWVR